MVGFTAKVFVESGQTVHESYIFKDKDGGLGLNKSKDEALVFPSMMDVENAFAAILKGFKEQGNSKGFVDSLKLKAEDA